MPIPTIYKPIFNVRIYGILIEHGSVLISDEIHGGLEITKYPGGGLQFGEGIIECLKREFREELETSVDIIRHFYTVDFFQPSAFDASQQVISVYYLVKRATREPIPEKRLKPHLDENHISHSFRWIGLNILSKEIFTFPIDKHVTGLLAEEFSAPGSGHS